MVNLNYIGISVATLGIMLPWLARLYSSWRAMKGDKKFADADTRVSYIWPFRIAGWIMVAIAFILFYIAGRVGS